ncbi:TerB N-terminal domain-containing protein [Marinobacter xiaoshiensis]|uniref:TerB N-terminal domain-containing protein n=1 Tax=Marinobacter xiaoshiensis TaxID=3073652 RepID=A0ABU2HI59_9GAMM|nr:TerB N-terminal domain-containing protein [Marinobacter sp. F60267]MDS1310750.1 TerB N-terminal domain-containing protein [Marinobacter sp. F60267]
MDAIVIVGVVIIIGLVLSKFRNLSPSKKPAPLSRKSGNKHAPAINAREHERPQYRDVRGSSDYGDDEDGLATFTISFGQTEEKSRNKSPGRWVSPEESVEVAGYEIAGGNFYFGGRLSATNQYGSEASLIDESLEVVQATCRDSDESLGYWPRYSGLSPKCRGAYLNWLSSRREDPDALLGYVFLYFYGLERRIIVDSLVSGRVDDTEFAAIASEIRRLLTIYGKKPAFNNYAFRLLEWMKLLRPEQISISSDEVDEHNLRLLFSLSAGRLVQAGQPIPAKMAFDWLNFTDFVPRTPARRCRAEFKKLFCNLYREQYAEGLKVKPNKTLVQPSYRPASGSLSQTTLDETDVPDPTVLKSVANKLIKLADVASEKLDSYSRYLGKEGNSRDDIEGLLLLPVELADVSGSPPLSSFAEWANTVVQQNQGLTSFSDFWSKLSDTPVEKVNKREVDFIQAVLDRTEFGIAPDPRFHHAKPSPTGNVVLFLGGHKDLQEPSKTFNEVGMALRLGAMVAKIDDHVHNAEVIVLKELIESKSNLSKSARASLHAYLTWRLNSPQNSTSLKRQIENLSDTGKHGISRILVSVALADGNISPDEIKQMEKLYTTLGLDKTLVSSDIHGLTATKLPGRATEVASSSEPARTPGFRLDESVLALHESETKNVQEMLGSIFTESDEDDLVIDEPEPKGELEESDEGNLDPEHRRLFEQLITREKWARAEVESMCEVLGLMVDGALETINDWSFDLSDEPVFEDDEDILVMLDVAEDIANR